MSIISFGAILGVAWGIYVCLVSGPSDTNESGGRISGTFAKMRKFRS